MISIRKRRVLTIVARCCWWRWGVSLVAAAYFEDNLHVVTGASSTDAFVEVVLGRGADEIVIVAWQELQAFGLRCERPEGDREVHGLIRVVADRYHPWIWICYPTCFILLFRHLWNTRCSNKLLARIDLPRYLFATYGVLSLERVLYRFVESTRTTIPRNDY